VALTVTSGVASTYLQIMTLRTGSRWRSRTLPMLQAVEKVVASKSAERRGLRARSAQQQAQVSAQQAAIPPLELQEKQAKMRSLCCSGAIRSSCS
jgi:outer membrane protein TolC